MPLGNMALEVLSELLDVFQIVMPDLPARLSAIGVRAAG
jgi:hypothetical protein